MTARVAGSALGLILGLAVSSASTVSVIGRDDEPTQPAPTQAPTPTPAPPAPAAKRPLSARQNSGQGGFSLSLPEGYSFKPQPSAALDAMGWFFNEDPKVSGAIWSFGPGVEFKQFGGDPGRLAERLRQKHTCGQRQCQTTAIRIKNLAADESFAYYEVFDPSIPAACGIMVGALKRGEELYNVEAINYDPEQPTRDDIFRIIGSLKPSEKSSAPETGLGRIELGLKRAPPRLSNSRCQGAVDDIVLASMPREEPAPAMAAPRPIASPKAPEAPAQKPTTIVAASAAAKAPSAPIVVPVAAQKLPAVPEAPVRKSTATVVAPAAAPPRKTVANEPLPEIFNKQDFPQAPKSPPAPSQIAAAPKVSPKKRSPPELRAVARKTTAPPQSFDPLGATPSHETAYRPRAAIEPDDTTLAHDAIPDLIEFLRSASPRLRARAADELGQRGSEAESAVPVLIKALKDKDDRVRSSAALALGDIGGPARQAIKRLKKLLNDKNADVQASAKMALDRLKK